MPSVTAKQNENLDSMLRRFKRACEKAGVLTELKRRAHYVKPTKTRAQEKAAAVKRYQKKLMKEMPVPSRGIKARKKKKKV
jgi:small subunit ribosomal protein S21